jgi:hypothetical protein
LTCGVVARAQDAEPSPTDIKHAARAFDNARNAFGAEDYATAADEFETADGYAPSPVALQWAIDAHHRAGNAARAATLAALAKQRHPEVAELVELAGSVISETEANLIEVQVVCDQPCELFVDSKIVHGQPASTRTLYLNPGSYTLTASFAGGGKAKAEQVEGEAGDARSVLFAPPAGAIGSGEDAPQDGMEDPFAEDFKGTNDPTADQPPRADGGGWSPTVFWVSASLTAVSGVVTIWSGLDTQNNPGPDVVKEKCKGLGEDCPEYQDGLQRQQRTNILLGVTGGLAAFTVVSAILTDWSDSPAPSTAAKGRKRPETAWAVEPWLSVGHHNAVGAMGRF